MTAADTVSLPPPEPPEAPVLLLVSDDLLFPSRIREGAKPLGYTIRVVATEAALASALQEKLPVAVLVNLTARRFDPPGIIASLKSNPAIRSLPVLAFAGHVEKAKHEAAYAAGADRVVANSSISLHLAALLPRLLQGDHSSPLTEEAHGDDDQS